MYHYNFYDNVFCVAYIKEIRFLSLQKKKKKKKRERERERSLLLELKLQTEILLASRFCTNLSNRHDRGSSANKALLYFTLLCFALLYPIKKDLNSKIQAEG